MRLLLVLLAAAALAPAPAAAQTTTTSSPPPDRTLAVTGQGEVELAPDRGGFGVTVTRTSPTSSGARSRTNGRVTAIVAAIRRLDVPRERIATSSITVRRQRIRTKSRTIRVRYRATAQLQVSVDGIQRLGRAIDAAAANGATSLSGPDLSFTPALRTKGLQQAEIASLTDARARADAAAASQGQRVVGIRSIDLDPGGSASAGQESFDSAPAPAAARPPSPTQVFAGLQTFSSVARVVYRIEPTG